MSKHSKERYPLPWRARHPNHMPSRVEDAEGNYVAVGILGTTADRIANAVNSHATLKAENERLRVALVEALEAYEAWEADIIINNETWRTDDLPHMTQAQYDRMIEIQDMRNAALALANGDGK